MSRALALVLFALCSGTGAGLATGAIAVEASSVRLGLPRLSLPELPEFGSLRQPRFHLQHVEFVGLEHLTPELLGATLALPRDLPLVDLDVDRVCAKIAEHPRVASCAGVRVPPDRLVLEVEERTPVARIGDTHSGFDADGATVWLLPSERPALARVFGEPATALPLLLALAERELTPQAVHARSARNLSFTLPGAAVRFRVGRDLDASLLRFDAWIGPERLRSERLALEGEVDFRFEGRAVLRLATDKEKGGTDGAS